MPRNRPPPNESNPEIDRQVGADFIGWGAWVVSVYGLGPRKTIRSKIIGPKGGRIYLPNMSADDARKLAAFYKRAADEVDDLADMHQTGLIYAGRADAQGDIVASNVELERARLPAKLTHAAVIHEVSLMPDGTFEIGYSVPPTQNDQIKPKE